MNITRLFKRMTLGFMLASVPMLSGCGDSTITWQEEVKLLDGRVIMVTQKRRYERAYTGHDFGNIPREFWLTFKLPEFGAQDFTWHENLGPLVLNVYGGKLYVISIPLTEREFRQYGSPLPFYIGYCFEAGKWKRIPFNEIPIAIYDTNLLIANGPPVGATFVSFAIKSDEIKDDRGINEVKRIDPKTKIH